MFRVSRVGWLMAAAVVSTALPCLYFRYLPMVDLPQHYAMVSVFAHYRDPEYGFASRYTFDLLGRPYATVYLLGAALTRLLPLGAAMRIVVAACTVAPLAGLWALLAATGRPRHHALASVPLAFGSVWCWGFLNFLLGTGLLLGGLALVVRIARGAPTRAAFALGALALLTLFTHVHGMLMLLALAPLYAWAHRREGTLARALLPLLLPAAMATALFAAFTWRRAAGNWPRLDPGLGERVSGFPELLAGGLGWPLGSTVALLAFAALTLALGDRTGPRRPFAAALAALAVQVLLYFTLPLNTSTVAFVSGRQALLCALFLLLLLPASSGRREHAGIAAAAALALAGLSLTALRLARFDGEARDFDPILAAMKPNRRVAPLIFDKGSAALPPSAFPYLHFAAYYQAARGGDLLHSFASAWNLPVRYRDDYPRHRVRDDVEWQPLLFSPSNDLPHFDYLLIRARRPVAPPPGLTFEAASGPWLLLSNPRAVTP